MRSRSLLLCITFITLTIASQAQIVTMPEASYIENRGQWDERARFLLRSHRLDLWLGRGEVMINFRNLDRSDGRFSPRIRQVDDNATAMQVTGHVIRMRFVGADRASTLNGIEPLPGRFNYFVGDGNRWAHDVPGYRGVRIEELYDGVSLLFHRDGGSPRYDFTVAPGSDPRVIGLRFEGGDMPRITEKGELSIETTYGAIRQTKPAAYQMIDGIKRLVSCDFTIDDNGTVRFAIGSYNPMIPLIIDPLIYSTFIGGSSLHIASNSTIDPDGNIYIVGSTISTDYPTSTGAYQIGNNKTDPGDAIVFVTKLNATGTALVFSTYIGGAETNDNGFGIAIDSSRNVYAVGTTLLTGLTTGEYPTTTGAYQRTRGGNSDGFVSKFSATGNALLYSTFLGGPGDESVYDVAVDPQGNAFAAGEADSTFPTTTGAWSRTRAGNFDLFVTKINTTGSGLTYSTYIGGEDRESPLCIALDTSGNAFIGGQTLSSNYPTTTGAYDRTQNSVNDGFVTKLNAAGSALSYSTYLGGTDDQAVIDIVTGRDGSAIVAGWTWSSDFPTTNGAFSASFNGGFSDGFLTKLNPSGASLVYSSFVGGSDDDQAYGVALDAKGNPYVIGTTYSTDFPTTARAYDTSNNGETDLFVMKLNYTASILFYSSYVGGSSDDIGVGVAVGAGGEACVGGYTYSTDFPTTAGAYQTSTSFNAVFALKADVPTVTLLAPIGGETWCTGTTQQVRWASSAVDSLTIALSIDGGSSWTTLVSRVPAAVGAWSWNIPSSATAGASCRIRLFDPTNVAIADTSRANFSINRSPSVTTQPTSRVACAGDSITFRIVASGTALTFQWRKNGAIINGARDSVFTIPSVAPSDGGVYDVVIGSACPPPLTSSAATLTVNTSPRITSEPTGDTLCTGEPMTLRTTATGSSLTYQWRKNGVDISGATTASYALSSTSPSDDGLYDVIVSGICDPPDTSGPASLLVLPVPSLTTQPTDTTLCAGGTARFHAAGSGLALTYQWRKDGIDLPGAVDSTLTISNVSRDDIGRYECVVSRGLCGITSDGAFLGVRLPPTIVEQPGNVAVCAGQPGSISLLIEGDDLTYQWRREGVDIPGATGPTLEFGTVTPADTGNYDVVVSGACDPPVTSGTARLTLATSTTITIASQPRDTAICQGERLVLRVRANGASLSYQWRRNGVDIPNGTAPTLTIVSTGESDAGSYDVAITSACGAPATSQSAQVTVNTATSITEQPHDTAVHTGESAAFGVTAQGVDLSYQWTKNGEAIPGATASTYTIDPVTDADSGTYTVIVTGLCGSSVSRHTILTILPPASIPVTGFYNADVARLEVIPHPASGTTQLIVHTSADLSRSSGLGLFLYDAMGRRVLDLTQSFEDGSRRYAAFDAEALPAGVYACRLLTREGERTIGLVVRQ